MLKQQLLTVLKFITNYGGFKNKGKRNQINIVN